jgi:hypothetical protein
VAGITPALFDETGRQLGCGSAVTQRRRGACSLVVEPRHGAAAPWKHPKGSTGCLTITHDPTRKARNQRIMLMLVLLLYERVELRHG